MDALTAVSKESLTCYEIKNAAIVLVRNQTSSVVSLNGSVNSAPYSIM